jgi:spermidine synthase
MALQIVGESGPVSAGVIGLGTGTMAAWGRAGDRYRFYDIDPEVIAVAKERFTYLRDSKARIETVVGDARLQLEREPVQRFNILAIDAFSSDSIPVHLVTREALAVYLRHIDDRGIIAFHVTNRFLDLPPVVADLAKESGLTAVLVHHDPGPNEPAAINRSTWMLLSRDKSLASHPLLKGVQRPVNPIPGLRTWTDDFSSLFQILK